MSLITVDDCLCRARRPEKGVSEPLVPVVGEYGAPEIVLGAHIVNWSNKVTKAATILNLKQNNARLEKVHKLLAEKCHVIERIYRINKADCIETGTELAHSSHLVPTSGHGSGGQGVPVSTKLSSV